MQVFSYKIQNQPDILRSGTNFLAEGTNTETIYKEKFQNELIEPKKLYTYIQYYDYLKKWEFLLKKMLFLSVLLFMFPLVSFANDLNEDEGVDSPKFTYEDYPFHTP